MAGGEGSLAVVDQRTQLLHQNRDGGAGAVDPVRHGPPGVATTLQGRVVGEEAGPVEAAGRGARQVGRTFRIHAISDEDSDDRLVGQGWQVHAHTA